MTLLRRLFAFIAGLGLALTVWGLISTAQVFSAKSLEQGAVKAGTYQAIARELPSLLAQVAPLTSDEQTALTPFIDTQLVQGWAETILPRLETYYRQGGAKPQLDISEIASRISASGIPLPAVLSTKLSQPLTVSGGKLDKTISETVRWSAHARIWGPLIALVGLALGLLLARGRRFRFLAGVFIWTGIILIGFWGLLALVPQLAGSTVVNSPSGALAVPLKAWIEAVIATPRQQLLIGAAVAAVLAMMSFVTQVFVGFGRHEKKHA